MSSTIRKAFDQAGRKISALAFVSTFVLVSCQSSNYQSFDRDALNAVEVELLNSRDIVSQNRIVKAPNRILAVMMPPLSFEETAGADSQTRFDFSVKDGMNVREFFALLTADTEHSVMIHPDVKGEVSALDLKNVTVDQVIQQIAQIYGYVITLEQGIYQVRPGGLQTRIFNLNYLNVSRQGTSSMSVSSSGISQGGQGGNGQGGAGFQGGVAFRAVVDFRAVVAFRAAVVFKEEA